MFFCTNVLSWRALASLNVKVLYVSTGSAGMGGPPDFLTTKAKPGPFDRGVATASAAATISVTPADTGGTHMRATGVKSETQTPAAQPNPMPAIIAHPGQRHRVTAPPTQTSSGPAKMPNNTCDCSNTVPSLLTTPAANVADVPMSSE